MLLFLSSFKLVTEIALLALAGQGVLGLICGARREGNPFYRVLQTIGRPFVVLVRKITPSIVLDRHIPLATAACLAVAWCLLTVAKISHCVTIGVEACR